MAVVLQENLWDVLGCIGLLLVAEDTGRLLSRYLPMFFTRNMVNAIDIPICGRSSTGLALGIWIIGLGRLALRNFTIRNVQNTDIPRKQKCDRSA
jgi:hypothetical protein